MLGQDGSSVLTPFPGCIRLFWIFLEDPWSLTVTGTVLFHWRVVDVIGSWMISSDWQCQGILIHLHLCVNRLFFGTGQDPLGLKHPRWRSPPRIFVSNVTSKQVGFGSLIAFFQIGFGSSTPRLFIQLDHQLVDVRRRASNSTSGTSVLDGSKATGSSSC